MRKVSISFFNFASIVILHIIIVITMPAKYTNIAVGFSHSLLLNHFSFFFVSNAKNSIFVSFFFFFILNRTFKSAMVICICIFGNIAGESRNQFVPLQKFLSNEINKNVKRLKRFYLNWNKKNKIQKQKFQYKLDNLIRHME